MSKPDRNRPRLGRGLSSLISFSDAAIAAVDEEAAAVASTGPSVVREVEPKPAFSNGQALEVPLAAVVPNPHQPRKQMNDGSLAELAASIKSTGLIQPIIVRRSGEGYELIAGERRWRAAQLAGLATIPAIVREVDGFTQAQMALIENIQREDLNPIDRAGAYRGLIDQLGLTQAELAIRLGEDRSSIANYLRLLDLADSVQDLVRHGRLSVGHAKLLVTINDRPEQQRLAELTIAQDLSVRNLERLLQHGQVPTEAQPTDAVASPHLADLEKTISRQLGLRVQIRAGRKKGRGKLVVHYATLDEFDQLVQRLGVALE